MSDLIEPETGAESILLGLRRAGVDYLFANAGTDFPPIIEALSTLPADAMPQPLTIPHETAAVAMAHGYYLVSGKPQAVMVHVNVGLANAVMGAINAASDNIPMILMSGRTPITETGRIGSRATPIQYGQEMYDQSSLVRDVCKFTYEMRYPEQGEALVSRAAAVAQSDPAGPVYLSLPREPLSENIPANARQPIRSRPAAAPPAPDPDAIREAAKWIEDAEFPVLICQRGDVAGRLGPLLQDFAGKVGIGVAEPFTIRNVLASADPMLLGYDPAIAKEADVLVVLDSDTPWIERFHAPSPDARVIHIGPDPHFTRMPVRGYQTDLAIASDPILAINALSATLDTGQDFSTRRQLIETRSRARQEAAAKMAQAPQDGLITAEYLSRCLSEAMDHDAVVFSELGVQAGSMTLAGQNRLFSNVHAGGLGWAIPAALGAQLVDRDRLVVACIGDGSHIFANPVACHQIAEALSLPILTVIKNNAQWNAVRRSVMLGYPDGNAARANAMPLTSLEPLPDFVRVAQASRAHAERVEDPADLPAALARAIRVIREEKRQALLDVRVAVSDKH